MLRPGSLLTALAVAALLCGCDGDSEPRITLLYPQGGERWTVGSAETIMWESSGVATVVAEMSWDGGETWGGMALPVIEADVGSVDWDVRVLGFRTLPQRHCIVRVRDWDNPAVSDRIGEEITIWSGIVWHVDDDAPPGGDGTSWATAFEQPQDAVDAASAGDDVWVAAGLYDYGEPWSVLTMKEGVAVYGGFSGDETDFLARDPALNESVLDGRYLYFPVVTCASNTVLDGFTIMRGWMESGDGGAGLRAEDVDNLLVVNCVLTANDSAGWGGGAYFLRSEVDVAYCVFEANRSTYAGGAATVDESTATFRHCRFSGNVSASGWGGGVFGLDSPLSVVDCTFLANSAAYGGAMGARGGGGYEVNVLNCTMVGNVSQVGSAFYQQFFCVDSTIANCTVSGNVATDGPAIASMEWSSLDVVDCVIWDNSVPSGEPLFAVDADSVLTVTYGCIEGGWEGQGNIDADPVFTDPGYWDDNGTPGDTSDDFFVEGDYHLSSSSPCIDAGDPASTVTEDIEGSPRNDGRVDMGAYEYQP